MLTAGGWNGGDPRAGVAAPRCFPPPAIVVYGRQHCGRKRGIVSEAKKNFRYQVGVLAL
jgi:hypothetical protein